MARRFFPRPGPLAAAALAAIVAACASDSTAPPTSDDPPIVGALAWSDPATWPSGQVPGPGDSVLIPAGLAVHLDTSPPPLSSLRIAGTLVFDEKDLSLTVGWIIVNGQLRIGTEAHPYRHRALITLTGSPGDANIDGVGNKVLGVTGILDLHGEPRAGWTRLSVPADQGATQLLLQAATGWRTGDRIVLASAGFDQNQTEEAIVASAAGRTVSLDQPLRFAHDGDAATVAGVAVDERTEVALLSRNITIQGDTGTSPGYGGHLIVLAGARARVEGVELFEMGQRGRLARYPMHWHVAGDVTGQYFRRNSVWRTFNRCVTVHGSDNAVVTDNVCYDHTGHGYFLEDGAETGNTISRNLGVYSRVPQGADLFLPSDSRPSTFWITNPDNTISDNVAAGSRGFGYWCAFPAAPTGLSTGQPDLPRTTPLRQFSGNSAHSNSSGGLNVDDGPRADGTTETTNYAPRVDPAASSDPVVAQFSGFRAWKHHGRAVWLRGRNLELVGAVLSDNGIGATFAANESFVRQSSFIGRSGLAATLPSNTVLRGFEFYDGRVGADGVRFIDYDAQTTVPSSGLGYNRTNGFPIDPENFAGDVSFTNANPVYLENPLADRDGDKAAVFLDRDGKVTGMRGAWVAANVPLLLTPACSPRPEWNAFVCIQRFVRLSLGSGTGEAVSPLTVQRDDGTALALAGVPNNPQSASLSAIPGRGYTVQWGGATPANPRFYLSGASAGDVIRLTLPYPAATMTVIRDYNSGHPIAAAASLAEFDASTGDRWFYDTGTGLLHLKLVVQPNRDWATVFVQP
jgi:hypothetical protein